MKRQLLALLLASMAAAALLRAQDLAQDYGEASQQLIREAMQDEEGWRRLLYLCDRIGHRLSGSPQLTRAVEWSAAQMREAGLSNVTMHEVLVPHWVRGRESARLVSPHAADLAMLGLGGSIATPEEGIQAEVVVVSSFEELEGLGRDGVEGRIVLYDMAWAGYGRTVVYRRDGASRAARLGAAATLIKSIGPVSLQTPHTGALAYDQESPRIPAAALTIEGATLIRRLIESGQRVVVELRMEARTLPEAPSANVIGEIPGREKPEEIVVMGGHLDSWDVGQGAHDDGAGCIAPLQAAAIIQRLGLRPRRTLRVVFWTNEENGLAGAQGYFDWAGESVARHVAAIEMDGGSERPTGFGISCSLLEGEGRQQAAIGKLSAIASLLEPIQAGRITWGGGGADISPLMRAGVPGFGLRTIGERYFDWHHTEADTIDKIEIQDFRRNVAALAVLSFILADMPEDLPTFLEASDQP